MRAQAALLTYKRHKNIPWLVGFLALLGLALIFLDTQDRAAQVDSESAYACEDILRDQQHMSYNFVMSFLLHADPSSEVESSQWRFHCAGLSWDSRG